jgi:hypothetical protein
VTARVVIAAAALAATLAATGCGRVASDSASKFKGEERQVANAIEDLQSAGQKGDAGRICRDLLAASVVKQIAQAGSRTCSAALKSSLDDADTFGLSVKAVTVRGTTATAVVVSDNGKKKDRTDTVALVKENRRWKLRSLGS